MTENPGPSLPLAGMRALVTGGAQGIGAGICAGMAAAGAEVAIVDLQAEKARDVANTIMGRGGKAIVVCADVSSPEGCRQAVKDALEGLGGIDILVNNVAPGRNRGMIKKLGDADWAIHQQLVLDATVFLSEAASEHLAANGCGAIVNISSMAGTSILIDQCSWPYHVSKAGLDQLTRWLAVHLAGQRIRVNAVAPALVDRDVGRKLSDDPQHRATIEAVVPLGRAGRAEDIAQAVVFLSSRQASYITGQVLTVDGGLGVAEVFGAALRAFKVSVGTAT